MTDNVVQFVPRPNPNRDAMSPEMTEEAKQRWLGMKPGGHKYSPDTTPSDYVVPDDGGLCVSATLKINRDLPDHRSKVKFKNHDKPVFILSADKAAGDAKNFREAAKLLGSVDGERAKSIVTWLGELAGKYEGGE